MTFGFGQGANVHKRNRLKLEFLGLPENVAFSRVAIATFVSQLDFTLDDLEEIKVATSEAVSNAIIHGYQNQGNALNEVVTNEVVTLEATLYEGFFEMTISDQGVGIANVEQAMQPAFTTCGERMGLGFSFMQSFMDEVQVESAINRGTRVWMRKQVKVPPQNELDSQNSDN